MLDESKKLYFGTYKVTGSPKTYIERKDYASSDYADDEFTFTISSYTGTTLTGATGYTQLIAGNAIQQGSLTANVVSVTGDQIVIDTEQAWDTGSSLTGYVPIYVSITTTPVFGDNPSYMKQWVEANFTFFETNFDAITVYILGDLSYTNPNVTPITLTPTSYGAWGEFAWGGVPWGGSNASERFRTWIPKEMQRCNWLTTQIVLSECFKSFAIEGITYMFRPVSSRIR